MGRVYLCGVPQRYCSAGSIQVSIASFGVETLKAHVTSTGAFACYARYLCDVEGYERVGGREFYKSGEPILILTKPNRFGGKLRPGKMGRWMPAGPFLHGLVFST